MLFTTTVPPLVEVPLGTVIAPVLGPSPPKSSLSVTSMFTAVSSSVVAVSSFAVGVSSTESTVTVTVAVDVSPSLSAMV